MSKKLFSPEEAECLQEALVSAKEVISDARIDVYKTVKQIYKKLITLTVNDSDANPEEILQESKINHPFNEGESISIGEAIIACKLVLTELNTRILLGELSSNKLGLFLD